MSLLRGPARPAEGGPRYASLLTRGDLLSRKPGVSAAGNRLYRSSPIWRFLR